MSWSMRCLLLGHDDWLLRSSERLKLRCSHCRRETPGWALMRPDKSRQHRPFDSSTRDTPRLLEARHRA
jgi:hypothetical protein